MKPPIYPFDPAEKPAPQDRIESGGSGQGDPLSLSRTREAASEKQHVVELSGDDTGQQKCFVCGKEIVAGGWFCRIPSGTKRIVLCCPCCALRYFETSYPKINGHDRDFRAYERSLHFLVDGEKPCL